MGIHTKSADDIEEVDVIVAGGGTAGCVVAARLAEADPSLSILVIEGGRNNHNDPTVVNPAPFLTHLQPSHKSALFYKGKKAPQLADREPIVPSGGILGGGSSINFMMYTRAQRPDFDAWNTPGWSADEILPYMKKLETYHGKGDKAVHGYDGPVQVTDGGHRGTDSEADLIKAAASVGIREIEDLQDLDSNDGCCKWLRTVSKEGKRQDAAHVYLHPKLADPARYPNLHVVVEAQVARVLFDENKRASGVEYRANPHFQASIALSAAPVKTVRARKMVIVSCGAMGTPSVLERSGLGNPEVLKKAGVDLVADVPGVGEEYQDHQLLLYPYRTGLRPDETIDALLSGRADFAAMLEKKDKTLGWNTVDWAAKIRPTEAEVTALGPEFRRSWDADFKDAPARPLMLMAAVMCFLGDPASVPEGQYVTTGTYTAYPYSRGQIHITSPDLDDPAEFDVGFFTDADDIDVKKQIWAYKKQRELMRRTQISPAGSKAACVETEAPIASAVDVKDIEYTAEDDAAIVQFLRENVNTTWHSLGTCKMAPREEGGVVNKHLSVYGVEGLKLADLSIVPENVGANTNNTALTVGEKAADIFIKELGLAGANLEGGMKACVV
ncbi:alcohol oxidase-like protein [Apiospora marii]|uniref:Alcohol oxidase-like protein n=1 Tax=Apiospora marii TaxID=335849 RepID=A0ABR1R0U7_9PEZI